MRRSTGISRSLPSGRTRRSSSTRSSVACSGGGSSPTSSRNSVPPWAITNRPSPPWWPKSSASSCAGAVVAQFTGTKGAAACGLSRCSAIAASSLPVPDSPVSSTVESTAATRCSAACRPLMTRLPPTRPSAGGVRCISSRRSTRFSRRSARALQAVAHGAQHLRDAEGLEQHVAGAGAQRLDRGFQVGKGRDQHHLGGFAAGTQVLQQRDAVLARQRDVQHHQVHMVLAQQAFGFLGRAGGEHPRHAWRQRLFEEVPHAGLVVDDEHHGTWPVVAVISLHAAIAAAAVRPPCWR